MSGNGECLRHPGRPAGAPGPISDPFLLRLLLGPVMDPGVPLRCSRGDRVSGLAKPSVIVIVILALRDAARRLLRVRPSRGLALRSPLPLGEVEGVSRLRVRAFDARSLTLFFSYGGKATQTATFIPPRLISLILSIFAAGPGRLDPSSLACRS